MEERVNTTFHVQKYHVPFSFLMFFVILEFFCEFCECLLLYKNTKKTPHEQYVHRFSCYCHSNGSRRRTSLVDDYLIDITLKKSNKNVDNARMGDYVTDTTC